MKTGMKKAVACYLAATMGATMLTGCGQIESIKEKFFPPSAEEILEACTDNMRNAGTVDMDVDMGFDISMSYEGSEVKIDCDASMNFLGKQKDKDVYEAYMKGEVEVSVPGTDSQNSKVESYTITEDDTTTTYTKAEAADEWTKSEKEAESSGVMDMDFTELKKDLTLSEETDTKEDKECYVFEGEIKDGDFLKGMNSDFDLDELGIEDAAVNIVLYVDKKEKVPVSMELAIDDEALEQITEKSGDLVMGFEDFTMELTYNEVDGKVDFEIPEEVFDAKEKETESGLFDSITGETSGDDVDLDEDLEEDEEIDTEEEEVPELEDDEEIEDEDSDLFDEEVINYEQLKAEGIECEEYTVDENTVYIKATSSNQIGKSLTVKAKLKKDGKVVGEEETYIQLEPNAYGVSPIYSEEAFDSVEYAYVQKDIDYTEFAGKDLEVTCEINDEEGEISGIATNKSDKTIEFPEIHIVFYDKDKNIIDTAMGFPEADEMEPSESSEYSTYFFCDEYDSYEIYTIAPVAD